MTHLGVVTSIDRSADPDPVHAVLDDGTKITAAYFGGQRRRAPWPLCTATFEHRGGTWLCTGPIGDRRRLLHDDFLIVPTTTPVAPGGSAPFKADTPWTARLGGGEGQVDQGAFAGSDAQGSLRITRTGQPGFITAEKDSSALHFPAAPSATHLLARVAIDSLAGGLMTAGFRAPNNVAWLSIGAGLADMFLSATDTLGTTQVVVSGVPANARQWYWWDLVISEGVVSAWVNGDGPYVITTNVPSVSTPAFLLSGTDDVFGYADFMTVDLVSPCADPTLYALN